MFIKQNKKKLSSANSNSIFNNINFPVNITMGISSKSKEGNSGLKDLKDLILRTKLEYQKITPEFDQWPCPFCFHHSKTLLQCRIHISREHPSCNDHDKSFLVEFNAIYKDRQANSTPEETNSLEHIPVKSANLQCRCNFMTKNVKGLKIHTKRKHSKEFVETESQPSTDSHETRKI